MEHSPIHVPYEVVGPEYSIYRLGQIYKVVWFKSTLPRVHSGKGERTHYDGKLDPSFSRARRMILEIALCNPWAFFCTFTLDKRKYDRYDLKKFHEDFTGWIRYQRKKLGIPLPFLLVPELHGDCAWHMHGLFGADLLPHLVSFSDLKKAGHRVPRKLLRGNYLTWPGYWDKFGFCSFGPLRSPVATAFYITKYVSKDMKSSPMAVGSQLYYPSRPLAHATKHTDVYQHSAMLDQYLEHDYDFCRVGYTAVKDGLDWSFALDLADADCWDPVSLDDQPDLEAEFNDYFDFVQLGIDGFVK